MTPWALTLLLVTLLRLWDEKQHNFEKDTSNITPARFGFIWFISFRGEALNVKVHDVWRADDNGRQVMAKALAWPLARWPLKCIQMLKQLGLYVNIIRTDYLAQVSLILLVPCLNIYPHPLYELKINLTSRQPHPLYVLILGLTTRPSHPLSVMTISLTMRPPHLLYVLTISLITRPPDSLYVMTISLTTRPSHTLYVMKIGLTTRPPPLLYVIMIGLTTRPPPRCM